MDHSDALILASIQSFTSFQTQSEYLNACFEMMFNDDKPTIGCYIRLDRSHIVKEILNKKSIVKQDSCVKKMIRRVLGFLITAENIKTVEEIISNIFISILNKYEHSNEGRKAKWALKNITDHHKVDIEDGEDDDCDEKIGENEAEDDEEEKEEVCSKFTNWVKKIIANVRENFVNEELNKSFDAKSQRELQLVENIYFVIDEKYELESCLIDFLSKIPLWSNVMMNSFGSKSKTSTSSPTEVEFKNVKKVLFKNEKLIRIDIFVEKYLRYILGQFKFALAENKNKPDNLSEKEEQIEESKVKIIEVSQENWRAKNVDISKPQKAVKSKRYINSILQKPEPFMANLPILPNGSTMKGNKQKPTIISHNTKIWIRYTKYMLLFIKMYQV